VFVTVYKKFCVCAKTLSTKNLNKYVIHVNTCRTRSIGGMLPLQFTLSELPVWGHLSRRSVTLVRKLLRPGLGTLCRQLSWRCHAVDLKLVAHVKRHRNKTEIKQKNACFCYIYVFFTCHVLHQRLKTHLFSLFTVFSRPYLRNGRAVVMVVIRPSVRVSVSQRCRPYCG